MDDLITVLELLRHTHKFDGYIHVKILPGAEAAQVERSDGASDARVDQSRGAVRRDTHGDRAREELRHRFTTLTQARTLVVREQAYEPTAGGAIRFGPAARRG